MPAANISNFTSTEGAIGMSMGAPLTEIDFVRGVIGLRTTEINIGRPIADIEIPNPNPPPETICFPDLDQTGTCTLYFVPWEFDPLSNSMDFDGDGVLSKDEREFDVIDFSMTWSRDSRNHFLNPTMGSNQQLTLEASLPGSSREFYKLLYRYAKYIPVTRGLTFSFHGNLGYGDSYDNYDNRSQAEPVDPTIRPEFQGRCLQEEVIDLDRGLPFYEHFYGGGVREHSGLRRQHPGAQGSPVPRGRWRFQDHRRHGTGHPHPLHAGLRLTHRAVRGCRQRVRGHRRIRCFAAARLGRYFGDLAGAGRPHHHEFRTAADRGRRRPYRDHPVLIRHAILGRFPEFLWRRLQVYNYARETA